ncbi:hypothetical protein H9P43_004356 [Blastocladiella emersonii ATCC 22665]|nr:hypothetical protein H9P43_004356 [Blastocladiella emersonii ATCC 22665]
MLYSDYDDLLDESGNPRPTFGGTLDLVRLEYLNANPTLQALERCHIDISAWDAEWDGSTSYTGGGPAKPRMKKKGTRSSISSASTDVTLDDLDSLLAAMRVDITPDPAPPSLLLARSPSPPPPPTAKKRMNRLRRTMELKKLRASQSEAVAAGIAPYMAIRADDVQLQDQITAQQRALEERKRELVDRQRRDEEAAAKVKQVLADKIALEKAEIEMQRADAREREIEARVAEYCAVKDKRRVMTVFLAWRHLVRRLSDTLVRAEAQSRWLRQRRYFKTWAARAMDQRREREAKAAAARLRRQAERESRAVRHHRLTVLSRAFVAWTAFTATAKHEAALASVHSERRRKVERFLAQLREKKTQQQQPASSLSPAPTTLSRPPSTAPRSTTSHQQHAKPAPRAAAPPLPDPPAFLSHMQERERRRQELKSARLARQAEAESRAKEAARLAALEAETLARQEAQRRRDEAARLAAAAEQEREHRRAQHQRAVAHADRAALLFRGLRPWRRFVEQQRRMRAVVDEVARRGCARAAVRAWCMRVREIDAERVRRAETFAAARVLRAAVAAWSVFARGQREAARVAAAHRETALQRSAVARWLSASRSRRAAREAKDRELNARADTLAAKLVPRRYWRYWREHVREAKDARWREYRRAVMRNKVRGWLDEGSSLARMCSEATVALPPALAMATSMAAAPTQPAPPDPWSPPTEL